MERPTPFLMFALFLFFSSSFCSLPIFQVRVAAAAAEVDVGVVLDLRSLVGKRSMTSISMALDEFYAGRIHHTTKIVLHVRDSEGDVVDAAAAALDLIKNSQVKAIIGPKTSSETEFIVDLGNKTQVPILSFSATSPSLSSARTPYFIRTTANDSSQVGAIAAIIKHFGWREAITIYEDSEYGNGIIPSLVDAFQSVDTGVPYRSVIPPSPSDDEITAELYKLKTMPTRVFVVHMMTTLSSRLFTMAEEAGMMTQEYVWIITDGLANTMELLDPDVADAMQGVLGVRIYVPRSKEVRNFITRWRRRFLSENPTIHSVEPTIFQLWAYDTAWALALAVEKSGASSSGFVNSRGGDNSNDLGTVGVSLAGPGLLEAIQKTRFRGVAGEFQLVDGQLQSSAFEIVNMNGKAARQIGFWVPNSGLTMQLNSNSSKLSLKPVLWPGDSTSAPKGWQIPTSEKGRLRIGVPRKLGFTQFVDVQQDPITNAYIVTGYCIDVFDAVVKTLPYSVSYEYVPYGDGNESYNDLTYEVFLQNFDAVVGDVTIVANRSEFIDFTLPFTESGVSLIAPVRDNGNRNAWVFLKPLTTDLWLGSLAFFFFTGFVVWVFEHRINEDFRGPPSQQFGLIFYFAFSTLVFAHKEKLVSNLSRFAVIVWVFVVLILTSSYTASLTSMLTVQQLEPTVTDLNELLKNGETVGYQDGSFTVGLLTDMKFPPNQLKKLSTVEQYADALSTGSAYGGVAAIFDEIPYLKLVLSKHCSDFAMVGRNYKTGGFGFVFPRGSPLVSDISRTILNVTEGDSMTGIERKWFGDPSTCPSNNDNVSSTRLDFRGFAGLFLITGIVSLLALAFYFSNFFYKEWQELKRATVESSLCKRLVAWARYYDKKDLNSHTFKKDKQARTTNDLAQNDQASESVTPQNLEAPQSPFSMSPFSDINCGPPEEVLSSPEPGFQWMESPLEETSITVTEISPEG